MQSRVIKTIELLIFICMVSACNQKPGAHLDPPAETRNQSAPPFDPDSVWQIEWDYLPEALQGGRLVRLVIPAPNVGSVKSQQPQISIDGKNYKALTDLKPDERAFQTKIPLEDTKNARFRIVYFLASGKQVPRLSSSFAIDTSAPLLTFHKPIEWKKTMGSPQYTHSPTVTLRGECEPGLRIYLEIKKDRIQYLNENIVCSPESKFEKEFHTETIAPGTHFSVSAYSVDDSGNRTKNIDYYLLNPSDPHSRLPLSWVFDNSAPTLKSTLSPSPEGATPAPIHAIDVSGECSEENQPVTIFINDQKNDPLQAHCENGKFSLSEKLPPSHISKSPVRKLKLIHKDLAGNETTLLGYQLPKDDVKWTGHNTPPPRPVLFEVILNNGNPIVHTMSYPALIESKAKLSEVLIKQKTSPTCSEDDTDIWIPASHRPIEVPVSFREKLQEICIWVKDTEGHLSKPIVRQMSYVPNLAPVITKLESKIENNFIELTVYKYDESQTSLEVFYTTDGKKWTPLPSLKTTKNATNGKHEISELTAPLPTYKPFRIFVTATDSFGMKSFPAFSNLYLHPDWDVFYGHPSQNQIAASTSTTLFHKKTNPIHLQYAVNPITNDLFAISSGTGLIEFQSTTSDGLLILKHSDDSKFRLAANSPVSFSLGTKINLKNAKIAFDPNGLLYLYTEEHGILQIDVEHQLVRKYIGFDHFEKNTKTPSKLHPSNNPYFQFDDLGRLYLTASCDDPFKNPRSGFKLVRISQSKTSNLDVNAKSVETIAHRCTNKNLVPPNSQNLSNRDLDQKHISFTIIEGGRNLLLHGSDPKSTTLLSWDTAKSKYQLSDSNLFKNQGISGPSAYSQQDSKLYAIRRLGRTNELISLHAQCGENSACTYANPKTIVKEIPSTPTEDCSSQVVNVGSSCPFLGGDLLVSQQGNLLFSDGIQPRGDRTYRIRTLFNDKLITLAGHTGFLGDRWPRNLSRGYPSAIAVSKGSAHEGSPFTKGLYITDRNSQVLYRIGDDDKTKVLWGNQGPYDSSMLHRPISKTISMGVPNIWADGWPIALDETEMPWMKFFSTIITFNPGGKIMRKQTGGGQGGFSTGNFERLDFAGGINNLIVKDNGVFLSAADPQQIVYRHAVSGVYYLDFKTRKLNLLYGNKKTVKIGYPSRQPASIYRAYQNPSQDTQKPGALSQEATHYYCLNSVSCYIQMFNNRLYLSEGHTLRYFENPNDPSKIELKTVCHLKSERDVISNFTITPDEKYLYYVINDRIDDPKSPSNFTYKSEGSLFRTRLFKNPKKKQICDQELIGPPEVLGKIHNGPNQFAWIGNRLLISNYAQEIFSYGYHPDKAHQKVKK